MPPIAQAAFPVASVLLPAGGCVSFASECDALEAGGDAAQARLARIVIIAAGPITNLIVTFLIFVGLPMLEGKPAHLPIVTPWFGTRPPK
jgi:hypothetical protein